MWLLICVFKVFFIENDDLQTSEEYGFDPMYICMCFFKSGLAENAFHRLFKDMISLNCVFTRGFSDVNSSKMLITKKWFLAGMGMNMYFQTTIFLENADPQTSHRNGFSLLCVHMCFFRWELVEKGMLACGFELADL